MIQNRGKLETNEEQWTLTNQAGAETGEQQRTWFWHSNVREQRMKERMSLIGIEMGKNRERDMNTVFPVEI